jgi:hypothetical protein
VIKPGRLVPTKPTDVVAYPTRGKALVAGANRPIVFLRYVSLRCPCGSTTTVNHLGCPPFAPAKPRNMDESWRAPQL